MEFDNPRQERISRRLELIGPGPANFYRDAVSLIADSSLATRGHLIWHCAREIESAIFHVLRPDTFEFASEEDKRGQQINAIASVYGIDADVISAWREVKPHQHVHRRALDTPASVDADFLASWEKYEKVLYEVLGRFEAEFTRSFTVLDRLLACNMPTRELASHLRNRVPNNPTTLGYFFDQLQNPRWLWPLHKEGFFSRPPEAVHNEEENTTWFPPWPQARYLARMAALPEAQKTVHEICVSIPPTENFHVLDSLADIMCTLPPDLSVDFVASVEGWVQSGFLSHISEKLGTFAVTLARNGKGPEAVAIMRYVLAFRGHTEELAGYGKRR